MATVDEALAIALDLQLAGRRDEAWELYGRILDAVPDEANALHLSGLLAAQAGHGAAAERRLRLAVASAPEVADYALNLAKMLRAQGRGEAAAAFRRALALAPFAVEPTATLAALLHDLGRTEAAARMVRRTLTLQPDLAEAWRHLAALSPEDTIPAARRAVRLLPAHVTGWRLLGAAWRERWVPGGAVAAFERALALDPAQADALSTRAIALKDLGRMADALAGQERADRLSGGAPEIRYSLALTRLLAGDLPGGFAAYEVRWRVRAFPTPPRGLAEPLWRGEPIAGRTILLHEEQGRGDTIQFARYAPLVAARGARVVLEVGADLVRLMRSLPGVARVMARGEPLPAFDVQCPLLSLPLAFGSGLDTVPATVPYLSAEPALRAVWRARLAGSGPAVGIVWAGNPAFSGDARRSPGLEALRPLLRMPGVRFFGLQVGPGRESLRAAGLPDGVTDLGTELGDFADTAAVMANLDLVITSCTASAHLAGALARPVWILLPDVPDWRWLMGRMDSPWYPTARLFRQPRPGDWAAVVDRVAEALRDRRPE